MITADFYSVFYIGIMVGMAVINGIHLGASKGYPFRRFANGFQVLVFMAVPVAFALGGQTSGFSFWTIIAFAFFVALDAVELTLIYCGKIRPKEKDCTEKPVKPIPLKSERRGLKREIGKEAEEIVISNSITAHSSGVIASLILNLAVFFISVLLVTGYSFQ